MNKQKPWSRIMRPLGLCLTINTTGILAENELKNSLSQTLTGTRLNQTQNSSVIIFTREQILQSGESNAVDFIRNLPINTSGSFRPQSGSSAQGDATVSLRGFGSARNLVLIDGRRMPKSPSFPGSNNLSLIPMGAIERIEILPIGGSAIYGSDAVGGVVNIITRTEFQGVEIMIGGAEVSIPKNGGEREEGSVVFGTKSDRLSLVAGISWNDREIVYTRDVPWRVSESSVYGNSFTTLTGGGDNFNWTSLLGACDFLNSGFFTTPNSSSLNQTRCAYDFTAVAAEEASTENKAMYIKAKHELNGDWMLWANTLFSQAQSFGRYAPVPDSSYFSTPLSASSPNNPTNPSSPLFDNSLGLSPQEVNWWHRFDALGNRDTTVTSQMTDFTLGLNGQVGNTDLAFGVRHTDNRMVDIGKNFLLRSAASTYIESGEYSLLDPYSTSENVLNAMRMTIIRDGKYDQDELFAQVSFNVFNMKGGKMSVSLGAEYRTEKYADLYDPQSEADQIGGSIGNSAVGERQTSSIFFEASLPLLDNIHANISGRHDDHSDFGNTFSSKITASWQPLKSMSFHAAYSNDFAAPDLAKLNSKPITTFSFIPIDYIFVDERRSNPFLEEEEIEQYSVSMKYQPINWFGSNLTYWRLNLSDRVRLFGAQRLIDLTINGESIPVGLGCETNIQGQVISCISGYGNGGSIDHSGINLSMNSQFNLWNGDFSSRLQLTHLLKSQIDDQEDFTNRAGTPPTRALWMNTYSKNNWSVTYQFNYISAHKGSQSFPIIPAPTWITHDLQFDYSTPWQSSVTVGVKNVGEKAPPLGAGFTNNRDYDLNLYDGFGRIVYARYTQTF